MNNNINHKKGFEEAIAGLSRGNWHNEDFNCQFGLLLEVGKTLAEYSLEIIEKLGRDNSLNLEKSKGQRINEHRFCTLKRLNILPQRTKRASQIPIIMQTEPTRVEQVDLVNPALARILINMDKVFRDINDLDDEIEMQFKGNPSNNLYQKDFREAINGAGIVLMHIENLISTDIIKRANTV
jgi:hypothetical protein